MLTKRISSRFFIRALAQPGNSRGSISTKQNLKSETETLCAYHNNFIITSVTARSVGSGTYHVHLGERAAQVKGQRIILTGESALDKALGREVYTSHSTSATDPEEVTRVLRLFALPSNPPYVCPLRVQWS